MVIVVAGIVLALLVAVVAFVMTRKRGDTAPAATDGQDAHAAAAPAQPRAPAPAPAPAPVVNVPESLDKISCKHGVAVLGAMPPFGILRCVDSTLIYEAKSRVVTKASAPGDDGSSTLQSLGAVEMGNYRLEIGFATIQRVDFASNTATVHADLGVVALEALGGGGPKLKAWLAAKGLIG